MMPILTSGLKGIITSSSVIGGRSEEEEANATNRLAGLLDTSARGGSSAGILDQRTGLGRIATDSVLAKASNRSVMDQTQTAMVKDNEFVIDIILPTLLIALLFVGNAVIVYVIFQYRKRKTPGQLRGEEVALSTAQQPNGDSRV